MSEYIYEVNRGCTYCGGCVMECPIRAIRMTPKGAVINQEKCIKCGRCVDNCASEAITKTVVNE